MKTIVVSGSQGAGKSTMVKRYVEERGRWLGDDGLVWWECRKPKSMKDVDQMKLNSYHTMVVDGVSKRDVEALTSEPNRRLRHDGVLIIITNEAL